MSHNFTTVALPCLRRSLTAEARVRARTILFGIRDAKNLQFAGVSPGTFHSPVSILMLVLYTYTMTTAGAT